MNAFSAAMADEVTATRRRLWAAQDRRDDDEARDALERLRDLTEISDRVRDQPRPPS